jgi:hypothetical protein
MVAADAAHGEADELVALIQNQINRKGDIRSRGVQSRGRNGHDFVGSTRSFIFMINFRRQARTALYCKNGPFPTPSKLLSDHDFLAGGCMKLG